MFQSKTSFEYFEDCKRRERMLARYVAGCFGLRDEEIMNRFSSADRYFWDSSKRIAIVEIKCRGRELELNSLGSMLISVRKFEALSRRSKRENLPAVMIQEFADGVFYYWIQEKNAPGLKRVEKAGRTKQTREDFPNDVEACYYVPIEKCWQLE